LREKALQETAPQEEQLRWDLTEFYPSPQSPELENDFANAKQLAQQFESRFRGKINRPELTAETVAEALVLAERIHQIEWKLGVYAYLLSSLDTQDEIAKALQGKVQEEGVAVTNLLTFFDLEWRALPEEQFAALIEDPRLLRWRHMLEKERQLIPHTLSEPEEKILTETSVTSAAWARHFERIVGRIKVQGKPLSHALNSELFSPDRKRRRNAQRAVTRALKREAPYLIDVFNALVGDRQIGDRLRSHPDPMNTANLRNEVSAEAVEALLTACERNCDIVARYYRLKRRLLGLPRLYDYDRYAPLPEEEVDYTLAEARELVVSAYREFSPEMGGIVERFFTESWIDTPITEGKRGGAFAYPVPLPGLHPFVMMNWTGNRRDTQVLAHELGHGAHQYLYGDGSVSILQAHPGPSVSEVASVFGEQLVNAKLGEQSPTPRAKLALLCGMLEDAFSTVFRQAVVMTRFEQRLYEHRAKGELSLEQINGLWLEANQAMFLDSVTVTSGYRWWWTYIIHFIGYRFYCYSYAFANLLVLALYGRYLEEGKAFVPRYLALLSAGGSDSPPKLLKELFEIDVEDPAFWEEGMGVLRGMVEEAERLADEI